jgi:putative ABC transport system substrate-binding protein
VFVNAQNPVGSGFVTSLARPGGNITGFVSFEPSMGGKWRETLKEVAPGIVLGGARNASSSNRD